MGFWGFRQYRDRVLTRARDESGQSIILISVVILSFLMFFSFAINTGLLINAKISVQNAADAAAYAGAAVQARQLNAISFLNYDMREQYKKFLFRYVFVGSMGSAGFPKINSGAGGTEYDFEKLNFSGNPSGTYLGLKVPVICIPLTANGSANDNCRVINLTNTAATLAGSNTSGVNPIQDTAIAGLLAIANAQNTICQGQGQVNLLTAIAWLFRANTSDKELLAEITKLSVPTGATGAADTQQVVTNISPLLGGLGLFPRNILNLMRMHTLEGFLNQKHETGITSESVDSWTTASDSDARERTIQAFRSAQANLNSDVFDQTLLQMDEMQADNLITLTDTLANFNVYIQHMSNAAAPVATTAGNQTICVASIDPFPIVGAPMGATASLLKVNYGIHLKTFIKPHGLLYLPNSDALELDAYAGAKPFGGRIGPASPLPFTKPITPPSIPDANQVQVPINDCKGTAQCLSPNLDISDKYTYYSTDYLTSLVNSANGGNPTAPFSFTGLETARLHAMAPSPKEVGHYNILPPPKAQSAMQYDYIPYSLDPSVQTSLKDSKTVPVYRFYAPVSSAAAGSDVSSIVQNYLQKMFPATEIGTADNPFGLSLKDMRSALQTDITNYIQTSISSGDPTIAENGETTTFAAIALPMPSSLTADSHNFWLTTANQVQSSWAPGNPNATSAKYTPRFGYSVKFATLHDLQKDGLGSGEDDLEAVNH